MAKEVKDTRMYLRVNHQLKLDIQAVADRSNVSVSELVTRFFEKMVALDQRKQHKRPR